MSRGRHKDWLRYAASKNGVRFIFPEKGVRFIFLNAKKY